jgi:small-conductance mechanosensitive channel
MSNHTVNYSSSALELGLIMHTTVTIGYDVPWKKVQELLINAADTTAGFLKEPKPFVLQTSLDDFYVSYQINAYTNEANKQAGIYSDLHRNIQDKFNDAGVEIMSPHYKALRDGNLSTIPADYLPKDYISPSFRVDDTGMDKK